MFEVLLIQSQEGINHFAGWGGAEGHQSCEQALCEQSGVS